MKEALPMLETMNLFDTPNATSLPVLVDGHLLSDLQDGLKTDPFGREVVHASRSQQPVSEKVQAMRVTSGPSSSVSSKSATLQMSLENKLRVTLEGCGSPEYALIWKHWDMVLGQPICALRGSVLRTSDSASGGSGWPTATVMDSANAVNNSAVRSNPNSAHHSGNTLVEIADTAGWPSPTSAMGGPMKGPNPRGVNAGNPMETAAIAAGYPTPRTITGGAESAKRKKELGRMESGGSDLQATAHLFGTDPVSGTHVSMEKPEGYRLNPFFSAWMMGFPKEWTYAGLKVLTRLQSKSRGGSRSSRDTATQ